MYYIVKCFVCLTSYLICLDIGFTSPAQICGEISCHCLMLILFSSALYWKDFVAPPSALKYSKGVIFSLFGYTNLNSIIFALIQSLPPFLQSALHSHCGSPACFIL